MQPNIIQKIFKLIHNNWNEKREKNKKNAHKNG